MDTPQWLKGTEYSGLQILWNHGEYALFRGAHVRADVAQPVLIVGPVSKQPSPHTARRLTHEFDLKDHIEMAWAALPLELSRTSGHYILVLADPGGEPLSKLEGQPMGTDRFLHIAVAVVTAVSQMHKAGLIHKDL